MATGKPTLYTGNIKLSFRIGQNSSQGPSDATQNIVFCAADRCERVKATTAEQGWEPASVSSFLFNQALFTNQKDRNCAGVIQRNCPKNPSRSPLLASKSAPKINPLHSLSLSPEQIKFVKTQLSGLVWNIHPTAVSRVFSGARRIRPASPAPEIVTFDEDNSSSVTAVENANESINNARFDTEIDMEIDDEDDSGSFGSSFLDWSGGGGGGGGGGGSTSSAVNIDNLDFVRSPIPLPPVPEPENDGKERRNKSRQRGTREERVGDFFPMIAEIAARTALKRPASRVSQ